MLARDGAEPDGGVVLDFAIGTARGVYCSDPGLELTRAIGTLILIGRARNWDG